MAMNAVGERTRQDVKRVRTCRNSPYVLNILLAGHYFGHRAADGSRIESVDDRGEDTTTLALLPLRNCHKNSRDAHAITRFAAINKVVVKQNFYAARYSAKLRVLRHLL